MTQTPIYLVEGSVLKKMTPTRPEKEADPQELIEAHPDLIGEEEGDLLLLKREQANEGGSLDHLFVNGSGIPVLVEVKRWDNPEIRRKIVAQMLDYAANNWARWEDGDAEQLFRERCLNADIDPDTEFQNFTDADATAFWVQVDQNMRDGNMKLLFVADEIPESLRRIIEFLNDQGMRCKVQAVALNYYRSDDGRLALAPQRYGQTEQTKAKKSASSAVTGVSPEAWVDERFTNPEVNTGFKNAINLFREIGSKVALRETGLSFRHNDDAGKIFTHMGSLPDGSLSLGFDNIGRRPGVESEKTRDSFFSAFEKSVGQLTFNSAKRLTGMARFPISRLADPEIMKAFSKVATAFVKACSRLADEGPYSD